MALERLWTPWRQQYVAAAAREGGGAGVEECFLCAAAASPEDDERHLVVLRAEHGFVILNRFPYNSGHLMVAPYAHLGDLVQLPPEAGHALFDLIQRAVAALREEYQPDGFNIGMNLGRPAGAGLPDHLHLHVVPRWSGDTNFMPIVAQTKVLPEALDQTWTRLRRRFAGPGVERGA